MDVTNEVHDLRDLHDAPVYSPSLDHLWHYGKNTPSSAPGSAAISSCKMSTPMPFNETPTRPSRHSSHYHDAAADSIYIDRSPHVKASHALDKHDQGNRTLLNVLRPGDFTDGGDGQANAVLMHKDHSVMIRTNFAGHRSQSNLSLPVGLERGGDNHGKAVGGVEQPSIFLNGQMSQ